LERTTGFEPATLTLAICLGVGLYQRKYRVSWPFTLQRLGSSCTLFQPLTDERRTKFGWPSEPFTSRAVVHVQ